MRPGDGMSQNVHCVARTGAGFPPEHGVRSAALVGCIRFLHGTDLILFGSPVRWCRRAQTECSARGWVWAAGPAAHSISNNNSKMVSGGMKMKLFRSQFEFSPVVHHGVALAVALLLVFSLQPAFSQTVTSSLSGTVADTSGATVPNAKVVLTNQDTNTSQSTIASGSGYFSFTAILPGTYTLTISAK